MSNPNKQKIVKVLFIIAAAFSIFSAIGSFQNPVGLTLTSGYLYSAAAVLFILAAVFYKSKKKE